MAAETPNYQQPQTGFRIDPLTRNAHIPSGQSVRYETGAKVYYNDIPVSLHAKQEVVTAASLTDGGGAVGTKTLTITVPKGAILLGSKLTVETGYTGDTSATITVGDGSDVDRYHTGTPSVFTAAADGVETGVPSGSKLVTADNHPVVTVTSATDITLVIATTGSITITIYYLLTV